MELKQILRIDKSAIKKEEEYTSKTKRGECKEENCKNTREPGSSRCAKHKAK